MPTHINIYTKEISILSLVCGIFHVYMGYDVQVLCVVFSYMGSDVHLFVSIKLQETYGFFCEMVSHFQWFKVLKKQFNGSTWKNFIIINVWIWNQLLWSCGSVYGIFLTKFFFTIKILDKTSWFVFRNRGFSISRMLWCLNLILSIPL